MCWHFQGPATQIAMSYGALFVSQALVFYPFVQTYLHVAKTGSHFSIRN